MRKKQTTRRILIVDDDIGARESLEHLLRDDYTVFACKSYDEVVKAIAQHSFDAAIIDIRLEHKDSFNVEGISILQKIIQEHPKITTIVLTGYRDNFRKDIFTKFKPDLLLAKGKQFDPIKFKENLREILAQKK